VACSRDETPIPERTTVPLNSSRRVLSIGLARSSRGPTGGRAVNWLWLCGVRVKVRPLSLGGAGFAAGRPPACSAGLRPCPAPEHAATVRAATTTSARHSVPDLIVSTIIHGRGTAERNKASACRPPGMLVCDGSIPDRHVVAWLMADSFEAGLARLGARVDGGVGLAPGRADLSSIRATHVLQARRS
jgi:hypothetical protein